MTAMKKFITRDNSESFLNEELGESYHSHTGAVEEATMYGTGFVVQRRRDDPVGSGFDNFVLGNVD